MSMCDYCIHHDCQQPQWHINAVINGDMYCDHFKSWLKRRISMNSVTSAFVTENKNDTRRNWMPSTVKKFPKGTKFLAVSSNYGGEVLGIGEVTENPFKQNTGEMCHDDYVGEGFDYLDREYQECTHNGKPLVEAIIKWIDKEEILTVVQFKILEIFPGMKIKYNKDEEIVRCVKALVKVIG